MGKRDEFSDGTARQPWVGRCPEAGRDYRLCFSFSLRKTSHVPNFPHRPRVGHHAVTPPTRSVKKWSSFVVHSASKKLCPREKRGGQGCRSTVARILCRHWAGGVGCMGDRPAPCRQRGGFYIHVARTIGRHMFSTHLLLIYDPTTNRATQDKHTDVGRYYGRSLARQSTKIMDSCHRPRSTNALPTASTLQYPLLSSHQLPRTHSPLSSVARSPRRAY